MTRKTKPIYYKKTYLFALAALFTLAAQAQISKGVKLVGGSVTFQSTNSKDKTGGTTTDLGKSTNFQLTPYFGIFIIDNFAAGAGVAFSSSSSDPTFGSDFKSTTILFSPFARYYVKNFFGEGQFGFGSSKSEIEDFSVKSNVTSWQLGAGYAAFISGSVAVEPFIGYRSVTVKETDGSESKLIDSGLFISISLSVYLGRE